MPRDATSAGRGPTDATRKPPPPPAAASARGPAAGLRATWSLLDRRHDVLDPGVVLEPVHRQVLAVARVLEPAMRHLGDERDVRVDPDAPEVEAFGHPHRSPVIASPH